MGLDAASLLVIALVFAGGKAIADGFVSTVELVRGLLEARRLRSRAPA